MRAATIEVDMIETQAQAFMEDDDREFFLPPNFLKRSLPETCSALIFAVVMWFMYQTDESAPSYRT